jgi:hypothetical protein
MRDGHLNFKLYRGTDQPLLIVNVSLKLDVF